MSLFPTYFRNHLKKKISDFWRWRWDGYLSLRSLFLQTGETRVVLPPAMHSGLLAEMGKAFQATYKHKAKCILFVHMHTRTDIVLMTQDHITIPVLLRTYSWGKVMLQSCRSAISKLHWPTGNGQKWCSDSKTTFCNPHWLSPKFLFCFVLFSATANSTQRVLGAKGWPAVLAWKPPLSELGPFFPSLVTKKKSKVLPGKGVSATPLTKEKGTLDTLDLLGFYWTNHFFPQV